ncbi:MAG: serine O-acetyltransferase [Pseudomonadota bacterium]
MITDRNVRAAAGEPAATLDPIWHQLRLEAQSVAEAEPALTSAINSAVLRQTSLEGVVAGRVGERLRVQLSGLGMEPEALRQAFKQMATQRREWSIVLRADLAAVFDRDPACDRYLDPVLYFKGFQALQAHRLAHWLWSEGRRDFALAVQSAVSAAFQVDIHPAVPVGRGIFMDHATGIVIGSTARLGDNVSILQGVTLGGTGKEEGDRHPKVDSGVLIGAGAQVLGNINIGHCSRVGAGSVVLSDVPAMKTVAGVPAKIIGEAGCAEPGRSMDHMLVPDGAPEF